MRQLRASSPNPFLFTRHIRPPPPEVASFLRSRGAGMFAAAWASVSAPPPPAPRTRSSVCSLPPERAGAGAGSGRCDATIPQWTFSPRLARCQPHWYRCEADRGQARSSSTLHRYSGCGASENLFSNEWKCRQQCVTAEQEAAERLEVTAPTDEALLSLAPASGGLLARDGVLARRLVLGSLRVRGHGPSLRPEPGWRPRPAPASWTRDAAQLGSVSVRLVAGVPALSAEDLRGVRGHAAIVRTKLIDVPEVSSYILS